MVLYGLGQYLLLLHFIASTLQVHHRLGPRLPLHHRLELQDGPKAGGCIGHGGPVSGH